MFKNVSSTQQRTLEHVTSGPPGRGHRFVGDGLVAPNKNIAAAVHAHEEVLVFSASPKRWIERMINSCKNGTAKQDIACAAGTPLHNSSRRVLRTLAKAT